MFNNDKQKFIILFLITVKEPMVQQVPIVQQEEQEQQVQQVQPEQQEQQVQQEQIV